MQRRNRIAILAASAALMVAAGTVLAMRAPQPAGAPAPLAQDGEDAPPTAEDLAHAADRLRASGIDVDDAQLDAQLAELANEHGLGGAVRIIAWAATNSAGATIDDIVRMRVGDGTEGSGMGWGRIAKDLDVRAGIGWIMGGGGGHGRETAPGQQGRDQGE